MNRNMLADLLEVDADILSDRCLSLDGEIYEVNEDYIIESHLRSAIKTLRNTPSYEFTVDNVKAVLVGSFAIHFGGEYTDELDQKLTWISETIVAAFSTENEE